MLIVNPVGTYHRQSVPIPSSIIDGVVIFSYNVSASSTAQVSGSTTQDVGLISGSVNGSVIKEDCSLMQRNGSSWSYPNQSSRCLHPYPRQNIYAEIISVMVANQSNVFYSGTSGILGLGTQPFEDTIYGPWLSRNPSRSNFTFGMALNPPINSSTDGGFLHLVVPDVTSYQGAVSWKNMTAASSASISTDWTVDMDGWSATNAAGVNVSCGAASAVLDPYFSSIIFPQNQARSICESLLNVWHADH